MNLMSQCFGGHTTIGAWWRCLDDTNVKLQQAALHRLPAIAFSTLQGAVVSLAGPTGHWLVLEFTSSDCSPCTQLLPALREFNQQQTQLDDGAQLYSIQTSAVDKADVRAFYDSNPITWPVILDDDSRIAAALDVNSLPEIWIVDPLGNVVKRIVTPVSAGELSAQLATVRASES